MPHSHDLTRAATRTPQRSSQRAATTFYKRICTWGKGAVFFYRAVVCAKMHGLGCLKVEISSKCDGKYFPQVLTLIPLIPILIY